MSLISFLAELLLGGVVFTPGAAPGSTGTLATASLALVTEVVASLDLTCPPCAPVVSTGEPESPFSTYGAVAAPV